MRTRNPFKIFIGVMAAIALMLSLSACESGDQEAASARAKDSAAVKAITGADGTTLEKTQLTERLKRQNKPTAVGYVYLLNFGKPFGYYTIKGKVSNAGSQLAPEDAVYDDPSGDMSAGSVIVDGPQDDGTYGVGDPGIFFFTTEGTMVETSIDYIYTDQPMDIDVPKLG